MSIHSRFVSKKATPDPLAQSEEPPRMAFYPRLTWFAKLSPAGPGVTAYARGA